MKLTGKQITNICIRSVIFCLQIVLAIAGAIALIYLIIKYLPPLNVPASELSNIECLWAFFGTIGIFIVIGITGSNIESIIINFKEFFDRF